MEKKIVEKKIEEKKVDNSRDLVGELDAKEIARRNELLKKVDLTAVETLELARLDARVTAHKEGRPVETVSGAFVEAARLELEELEGK